jgi:hypothetical protein
MLEESARVKRMIRISDVSREDAAVCVTLSVVLRLGSKSNNWLNWNHTNSVLIC